MCLASADTFEDDNSAAQAPLITVGNPPQVHNLHFAGDSDWVRFSATAGVSYTLETSDLGPGADTYLYLYDTDGATLLASNDDYGGTLASRIEWSAPADGTYFAVVRHWNPNAGGCGTAYKLILLTTPTPSVTYVSLFGWGAQAPVREFNGAGSIAIGPDGSIYVADIGNSRIQKFDSGGNFITMWGSMGSGDGQFWQPEGVAVDPAGNVYVADSRNNRIQKFTAAGNYLGQWGSYGQGDGQFSNPKGIAVDAAGNVYVSDAENHRIQKFTATGVFVTKWGSRGSGDGQFNGPYGLTTDSAGNLYVADRWNSRIQKFTSTGTFLAKWGTDGTGNGQFREVWAVALDSAGNIYATDHWGGRVQKFSPTGAFIAQWNTPTGGGSSFALPSGIAVDQSNNLYVAEFWGHRVQKSTTSGVFLLSWGQKGTTNGQFDGAGGIAVAPSGEVYVADTWNARLQKFASDGAFLSKRDDMAYVGGIAIDSAGIVYAQNGDTIRKLAPDGSLILQWGGAGTGDGQFIGPDAIAVDRNGYVYVADRGNHRIQKFTSGGAFVAKWGSQGTGDGQFDQPSGIAVDELGNVYVADSGNSRVQKFSSSGTFLTKWGGPGEGDGQFNWPQGLAVDSAGTLYVADTNNHRIQRFTSNGGFLTKWGGLGCGRGQMSGPKGVAVDRTGNVYVLEYHNGRVQVFGAAVPATWRAEYYGNRWLAGAPGAIRNESAIDHTWSYEAPIAGIPADNFSVRWERNVHLNAGTYRFSVTADDGVRLWVDEHLLVEKWQEQHAATYTADMTLTEGYHLIRMEYFENLGVATARLSWEQVQPSDVRLFLEPDSTVKSTSEMFTLTLKVELPSSTADTVDAYIDFDPTYLEVVDALGNPATTIELNTAIFGSATVNSVNNALGQINFSASKY
ncbi:MAG: SMP-30/gluconolactonase/LRE family protein, partial [candidate division WOR-3 bacterium]